MKKTRKHTQQTEQSFTLAQPLTIDVEWVDQELFMVINQWNVAPSKLSIYKWVKSSQRFQGGSIATPIQEITYSYYKFWSGKIFC